LLTYALVTIFTPGPNNLIAATSGLRVGVKRTLPALFGIAGGFLVLCLTGGFFADFLLRVMPQVQTSIRWLGTAYIVWLAVGIVRSRPTSRNGTEVRLIGFWTAVALQFVNPKAVIFVVTIFTVLLAPAIHSATVVILSTLCFAAATFASVLSWATFGSIFRRFLQRPKVHRVFNVVLALLLLYVAVEICGLI
jgi:threonine/homoserine/homoserine lactone efflux protein